ncbi:hypothetical protein PoB_001158900 [Plakobranchus ocellatus]|uniref:Uncharacterized protein n=1 Tax=Plakobranchus ocellatus TaxID=259542 RepID=A0AAV3YSR2_9GAST|nr:hypothetical protein PoB_001158900 [Plakobranchus ocellatus]
MQWQGIWGSSPCKDVTSRRLLYLRRKADISETTLLICATINMRLRRGRPCSPTPEAPAFDIQHFVTTASSAKLQISKGNNTPGKRLGSINLNQKIQHYKLLTRADLCANPTVHN